MTQELYKTLEKPQSSKYGGVVQKFILINILINVFVVFIGLVVKLSPNISNIFTTIENITVTIFIIELVARYISIGANSSYRGVFGKIRFTLTPFIIIDILSLIPYFITGVQGDMLLARVVRFLRFFRVLKLIRVKSVLKKFFSFSSFATSSIFTQMTVLFIFSIFFIFIFSFAYSDDTTSLSIFLEPSGLVDAASTTEMIFGTLELIIGLFVGGALISIITELIANITSDISSGYYAHKEKEHIIIINHNSKLEHILKEINHYCYDTEQIKDVVIYLPLEKDIEKFHQNLKFYSNIEISLHAGDLYNWNSYERLNINYANKVLILEDKNSNNNLNIKISRYILSHRMFDNSNLQFIIETQANSINKIVYEQIFNDTTNKYSLIEHNSIIQSFLNRSIIELDYFAIYLELLSFEGSEFYRLEAKEIFDTDISFGDAYIQFNAGVLVGIRKDEKLFLNPPRDMIIEQDDKLVTILSDKTNYIDYDKNKRYRASTIDLQKPSIKSSVDICIVGDYDDIKKEDIKGFLTDESINNFTSFIQDDKEYMKEYIWDDIISKNYDIIILNMEDEYEFILTMYLKNIYKDNAKFTNSLINIIHDPINAKLLESKNDKYNIILSEKLVGEYATQVMFNHGIVDIFDEITTSKGNELYLLNKVKYGILFDMEYDKLKNVLLKNRMLYIGIMKDGEFFANHKAINDACKIVVLTQGE